MKVYAGAPAAARCYLEAGRSRADDYYLAEGTGLARRYTATAERVAERAPLDGERYEAWVAGRDPTTGRPKGRLRTDDQAVRFVEVVVNGPKSWSLAAALHPDIAAAYDAAQDRAAEQVIDWLAQHATTRVGPRGEQVQVPVEVLEAVTVRHCTSRTGDPHRHLHLQINARVFAAGKWRGLHTVGIRDSLDAINGIGHAAVVSDPQFRTALAMRGYTLNGDSEIEQLAAFQGPFSARAAQIARNQDRYEREWTQAHPGEQAGPALRRAWDARAWADGRPDKVTPSPGVNLDERWRSELQALGYRDRDRPIALAGVSVGALDRDGVAERVLIRLAARRSAWNAADVRGEAERMIAGAGIVADAAVRLELAEDLTARALDRCVPLVARDDVPEHIRALTSRPVLAVEADLTVRLADRGRGASGDHRQPRQGAVPDWMGRKLDQGQRASVEALTGDRSLIVMEGAAGTGKTTTLSATRLILSGQGRRMMVVSPTFKAAKVAGEETGAAAGSAAWLAFQHGWRWNPDGAWIRLAIGQPDPITGRAYDGPSLVAQLRPGDLLVVDEAGMLDQDTARAMLTLAEDSHARLALIGDRHQLAAVGRGGVLDLALDQLDPAAHLTLDSVHRFTCTDATGHTTPDKAYAALTLAMRTGEDPGAVFDSLLARGQIRLHPDLADLQQTLAHDAASAHAAAERITVVADTGEQVTELNAAVRDRLVTRGLVDDTAVVTTALGERVGMGDRVTTRRNDAGLGVANRDTWHVTAVDRDGGLRVTPADRVTPHAVNEVGPDINETRTLPAGYVTSHVQLGYASTVHGAQGATVTASHVVIGERTGAASAYVGMTRGRQANTAHLIAADTAEAREQWISVFARDRADLGPARAGQRAALEVDRYGPAPTGPPAQIEPAAVGRPPEGLRLRAPQYRPTPGVRR